MKIYLDVCCLCRPFDNQRSGRIRIESTAVREIIRRCNDEYTLVTSEAVTEEISQIPDINKRLRVENIVLLAKERILIDEKIITRMHELIQHGGKPMDCLHIACAEKAEA